MKLPIALSNAAGVCARVWHILLFVFFAATPRALGAAAETAQPTWPAVEANVDYANLTSDQKEYATKAFKRLVVFLAADREGRYYFDPARTAIAAARIALKPDPGQKERAIAQQKRYVETCAKVRALAPERTKNIADENLRTIMADENKSWLYGLPQPQQKELYDALSLLRHLQPAKQPATPPEVVVNDFDILSPPARKAGFDPNRARTCAYRLVEGLPDNSAQIGPDRAAFRDFFATEYVKRVGLLNDQDPYTQQIQDVQVAISAEWSERLRVKNKAGTR